MQWGAQRISALICSIVIASMTAGEDKDKPGVAPAGMGRVTTGDYVEVDDKDVANPLLGVRVQEVSPNIIELRGANGWVTYASYDEAQKEYRGFFEWQQFGPHRSPGGKWADLYHVRLVVLEGGKLHMNGRSKTNDFVIRAKVKP
jgi:hypothetical protein